MNAMSDSKGPTTPVLAVDCPWCDATILVDDPLPELLRCAACAMVFDIAPDDARHAAPGTRRDRRLVPAA